MKKFLALAITGMLVLGSSGVTFAAAETTDTLPDNTTEIVATEQSNLYLVPGTYSDGGTKVENTIASGATKLTSEQCEEIYTENAYVCNLAEGAALPVPTSKRVDKDGKAYTFNGWWMIVDATVTYFKTVPEITEQTFLYADWRADLSQRKDPIIPEGGVEVEPNHYMLIKRAETGETEKITLHKAFTNMMSAETLGYLYPVELYTEGFVLYPGDVITVYTTGLTDAEEAVISPILNSSNRSTIQLESSGDGSNATEDYLSAKAGSQRVNPSLTCITEEAGYFNIYIKYFSAGSLMTVYMEPKE